jgi:PAS domain S-box-containing protein
LSLPDSYGLATIQPILELKPELPLVAMSGLGDQALALEVVKAGAQDYLVKGRIDDYSLPRAIQYAIERKRTERALRQSEEKLRLLFDILPVGISILDQERNMLQFNPALEKILDISREGLLQKKYIHRRYLDADGQEISLRQLPSIQAIEKQQNIYDIEVGVVKEDGETIWTNINAVPVDFPDWKVVMTTTDITKRKQAEEALKQLVQTHQRLVTAIEQVTENIMITDIQGKIVYVNPGFERLTGYSRAEVIGQTPRLLKSGKQDPNFYRELWATITAGQVWQGRLTNQKKDGTAYVEEMTITPVRDQAGVITNYVAVKRDVTRELQLEEQYRQAQKLEAIGRLTGGVAHDFNNLLTAIIGFAELAYLQYPAGDPQQELLDKVLHSSQRAADLVRQLLVFSRKQAVEARILNLNESITELNKMLGRIIGEDIVLRTILAPDLWLVRMDPSQMVQIIVNLVVNARDAMPEGGKLVVETANIVWDEAFLATHLKVQPGEYVLLNVSDTGLGMSQEVQTRIFEPFFTTKGVDKGTGLGLATIYSIVEQSRGTIQVYSEEGQGTTFKIYLPRANVMVSRPVLTQEKEEMPTGSETILLVEDNESVRTLFSSTLQAQGYNVISAADGHFALKWTEDQSQSIHLLVTDIVMPHLNGKLLAEQLAQRYPDLKIIFMSGYTDNILGDLSPHISFLQKPFSPITLVHKVRQVLDAPQGEKPENEIPAK